MVLSLKKIFPIFLLLGVCLGFYLLVNSQSFLENSDLLSLGITFDLVILIPALVFLLIRSTKVPNTLVVPVFILGLVLASYILPTENQKYLELAKTWILPIVELSFISFLIWQVRKAVREYKYQKRVDGDFFTALKETCAKIVPRFAVYPVATEVAVFYYGFFLWSAKPLVAHEFSYHKSSPSRIILGILILLVIAETFVFHLLLMNWSQVTAWILTGLSIYTGFQVFGILKSMNQRPISVGDKAVHLKYGLVNEVSIPFEQIESIEQSTNDLEEDKLSQGLSILGSLEPHNVIIRVNTITQMMGLYGMKRSFTELSLFVDEPERFVRAVNKNIQNL